MDVTEGPLVLDMLDPEFGRPSDVLRRAQDAHWYARGSLADYVVLRYKEISTLLREPRLHDSTTVWLLANGIVDGPLVTWWNHFLLNLEGESHTRIRRLVGKAFTPPAIERLRPLMRTTVHALIDALPARDTFDFVTAIADPYPLEVICELLGIPRKRRAGFRGWANEIGKAFGVDVVAHRARIESALSSLLECVDDLLAERRRTPAPDLLTALLEVEENGDRLTPQELRMLVVSLVFAGNDTTRNQLSLAMYAFLKHPAQWALLRAQPTLANAAVEEVLRVYPATPGIGRIAVEDFTFQGVRFTPGTVVYMLLIAANSDPRMFGTAAPFDITVEGRPRVLTFASGIHHCLGNWLARAELQEALPILASRLPDAELLGEPRWMNLGITGPSSLPMRLAAAKHEPRAS